jgi:hypothetical protein
MGKGDRGSARALIFGVIVFSRHETQPGERGGLPNSYKRISSIYTVSQARSSRLSCHARRTAGNLEHDPEKRIPVFGKDHAQTTR